MPSATSVPAALTIATTRPTPSSPVTSVEDRDDVAGVHRVARRDAECGEHPVARGDDLDLHLHRFHDEEGLVLLHAGARLRREPIIVGNEEPTAWVTDTSQAVRLFGVPIVDTEKLIAWTADWVSRSMPSLGKPTKYEVRDGRY